MTSPHTRRAAVAERESPPVARSRTSRADWLVLAFAFVLLNVAGARYQPQISFHAGQGWEGQFYCDVAGQFAAGHVHVASEAPLVYRVGTPLLAGILHRLLLPHDLFACFRAVNLVANALTLGLLILWLRRFVGDWRIRTALGLMFLLQWDTPVRWLYFCPAHVDPWMWVWLLTGLLAIERYRERPSGAGIAAVAAVAAVGVVFREVVMAIPVSFLFVENPLEKRPGGGWSVSGVFQRRLQLLRGLPLAAGLGASLIVRMLAHATNGYSFLITALHFVYDKPVLVYVQSLFAAFGPVLWFPIIYWRQAGAFLADQQYLAVNLGLFALLGLIGGTDTERLLYWSMPVVYILIGRVLEQNWRNWHRPFSLFVLVGLAQIVADRAIFWPIPDYPSDAPSLWPVLTPFGRRVSYMELYAFYEPRTRQLATLLEYLAFGGVLAWWLRRTAEVPVAEARAPIHG